MSSLRMNVNQWARYHRQLGDRIHLAGQRGCRSAALRVVRLMVERTRHAVPASDVYLPGSGRGGAVNTGEFLRGWKWIAISYGARVMNDRPYSSVIEYGRRPGSRPPPTEPIMHWLQRRIGMSEREARGAAWVVARAIGRRGLRGRAILTGADATAQIEEILEAEITHELDREIARPP